MNDRCTWVTSPWPWQVEQRHRLGAVGRARTAAARAEHGGVDPERLGGAEGRLGELEVQPHQGVLAAADPRPRAAGGLLAEHRVDQVGEVEARRRAEAAVEAATHPAAERVAAAVVEVALLGVLQHLVRLGDLLEPLRRVGLLWRRRDAASSPAGGRPS